MANGDERNAYNERLIDVIEREWPLWDLRDRNYKSRAVTDAAWRHVATVMGSTVAEVKARWKNLRDTFRRVLKERTRALKSGAPADDELDESTKWHFFSRLLFLKETMEGRPTSGNVEPLPFKESAPDVLAPECILEDVCDEPPGNQGTATSSGLPPPPKKKPKRSKYDDEIEELSKFITEKPDEHERFGAFLVEKMRRVPPDLVDVMQLQLLETVTKFLNPVTVVQPVD
ncbi:transcription factor Adf-1-like [Rhipicephalus microplus]|uniref:transcription factor Adf-1-like n=1 Tax=Rhipicephalus microplus TaxID=6941 RepID=UPI003F6C0919